MFRGQIGICKLNGCVFCPLDGIYVYRTLRYVFRKNHRISFCLWYRIFLYIVYWGRISFGIPRIVRFRGIVDKLIGFRRREGFLGGIRLGIPWNGRILLWGCGFVAVWVVDGAIVYSSKRNGRTFYVEEVVAFWSSYGLN